MSGMQPEDKWERRGGGGQQPGARTSRALKITL